MMGQRMTEDLVGLGEQRKFEWGFNDGRRHLQLGERRPELDGHEDLAYRSGYQTGIDAQRAAMGLNEAWEGFQRR